MSNLHLLRWKSVACRNINGRLVEMNIPLIVQFESRGRLLSKILSMQIKDPISFEAAVNLISDRQVEAIRMDKWGSAPGHDGWYTKNFVEYISDLGHHIELTGDEFDTLNPQSSVI
jgi:hypothetical protein